jgi:RimJ/RimL family protein N-acetyltransferase
MKEGTMKQGCIEGLLITLWPLSLVHIDSYLKNYSRLVQTLLHVVDSSQERLYLEKCIELSSFFYVISPKKTTNIIGGIEIRHPTYRSQLYCWLNEEYWGKSYFQEAMQLLAYHYFKTTGHSSIGACVDYANERSFYALKKAGFQEKRIAPGPYGLQYELILKNR